MNLWNKSGDGLGTEKKTIKLEKGIKLRSEKEDFVKVR